MMKLIKTRRSIREFLDKDVPDHLIAQVIEAGIWAPSACNLQPVVYVIIKNNKNKQQIVEKGKAQSVLLKAPVVIAVFYDTSLVQKNYANIQSASAAIQNMLLYAHSIKLGSLWVGGCDNKEFVKKYLNVPEKYDLCAFVLLGYSKSKPLPPKRKLDAFYYETFSGSNSSSKSFLNGWSFKDTLDYQNKIARRGFRLEDVREGEAQEVINELEPALNNEILDYHNFSAMFLSQLQKNHNAAGHFFSEDVKEAALMYNKYLKNKNLIIGQPVKQYNTICSFYKLEHIPNLEEYLNELRKYLKEEGKLIIVTVNPFSWKGLIDFIYRTLLNRNGLEDHFYSSLNHISPWNYISKHKLKKALKKANFKIIKSKGKFILPYYEFKDSILAQKKLYTPVYKLICFILKETNETFDFIKINNIFGKSRIIVCEKK